LRLALGTVQFGLPYGIANQSGQVSHAEAKAILAVARSSGIDTLDTAIAYGESEACLGAVGTSGFKVVTKLPAIPDGLDDVGRWVHEQMQTSFQRLGIPTVYGLLLHRSQQLVGPAGKPVVRALEQLKAEGIVTKIGVSIYSPSELETVTQSCEIDLVQAPLNLVDRRLHTSGWLRKLHDAGVEIHTRSAFLQGLLLMPRAVIPAKFAPWNHLWVAWHGWQLDRQVPAPQACISFVQSFHEVDKVVVGVDSAAQLEQLIVAAEAQPITNWPAISSHDEELINPSNWGNLQ
jgi:aryl-alcohol dehydrogenase-like predicted oxidoreductase